MLQKPKYFEAGLKFFGTEFSSMTFELEAEQIFSKMFESKIYVDKERKPEEKKGEDTSVMKHILNTSNKKQSWKKKVSAKYSFKTDWLVSKNHQHTIY